MDTYEVCGSCAGVAGLWKALTLQFQRYAPIRLLHAHQQDDFDFSRSTQRAPTTPFRARAGVPPNYRGTVRVTPAPSPKRRRWLVVLFLFFILIVTLIGAGLGAFLSSAHRNTPAPPESSVVGHAFFVSSGQWTPSGLPATSDELQISLQHLAPPAPGKSYYAWLLRDENQPFSTVISLGVLSVKQGTAQLSYQGDSVHTNLLAFISRILITEEDATIAPLSPSLDHSTWKYIAELPQAPDPHDAVNHFSMLDHLRFLLVQDPDLKAAGLPGGLDTWFLLNTGKVAEWAYSARDFWQSKDIPSMRQHFIRILDYLDGPAYVSADVPPGTPVEAPTPIGLLGPATTSVQNPLPTDYLHLMSSHLNAIAQAPGVTPEDRQLAAQINASINHSSNWLEKVRQDAKQLISMNDTQLLSQDALSTLNNMMAQAFYAYTGQLDPSTDAIQSGVVQIHYDIEHLATFDITPYKAQ